MLVNGAELRKMLVNGAELRKNASEWKCNEAASRVELCEEK